MKFEEKRISCFLLCCFALSSSVFASDSLEKPVLNPAIKPVQKHEHPHRYKGEAVYKDALLAPKNHFEFIGALGMAKLNAGNGVLGVTNSESDTLVQTNSSSWNTLAGQLGAGYIYYFKHTQKYSDHVQWLTSVEPELNLYQLSSNSIKGDVLRFGNPNFNDLNFDIPVHSTRLMLDAALTVATWKRYSLYAIGGIGNAWTHIGYSDQDNDTSPTDTCPEQRVSLNTKSNSNFVWELGAGLTYAFNDRVGVSLEYLYTHLGSVSTSGTGTSGTITIPMLSPASFNLKAQTALLGIHVAL